MTHGLSKPEPQPKPDPIDRKRQRYNKAEKFRDAVWKEHKKGYTSSGRQWGHCFKCLQVVIRGEGGQVDHIQPRSIAPELIYEPSNGRLSCNGCNIRRKTNWRERV